MHIGPLPTPEDFARYNEVVPDAAERILRQAEKEQDFRHRAVKSAQATERAKTVFSFLIAAGLIVVAGIATWLGNAWIAVPLGSVGLASILLRRFLEPRGDE